MYFNLLMNHWASVKVVQQIHWYDSRLGEISYCCPSHSHVFVSTDDLMFVLFRSLAKHSLARTAPCLLTLQTSLWTKMSAYLSDSKALRIRALFCRISTRSVFRLILIPDLSVLLKQLELYWVSTCFFFSFQTYEIVLALENGYLTLQLNGKKWKSNKQYHDGLWHYLTVTKRAGRYKRRSSFPFRVYQDLATIYNHANHAGAEPWVFFKQL